MNVEEKTIELFDAARQRRFPCEIWSPVHEGRFPLVVYSHSSGQHRRAATYLCTHLASHGYVVAAMDHSEVVMPELSRKADETAEEREARVKAVIGARVPDIRFLIDSLEQEHNIDPARIGIVGHSFGGWTALAAVAEDLRIRAVVAHAPGGASKRKPGILPLSLNFEWRRDVPVLYIAADQDASLPLDGMYELYERTRGTKQIRVLERADHLHFVDNVEAQHEAIRKTEFTGALAWISKDMKPISELCSGEEAHRRIRGWTLEHFDRALKGSAVSQ